jgi:defect-in-organelle-trafficking protein DotB
MLVMAKNIAFQLPNEPLRFMAKDVEAILEYGTKINASDITLQTGEPVIVEVYGRIYKISNHKLSTPEVGDLLNAIYGPNGTAQILSGQDVDTHYEFRPTRHERYRYRVNGTGCQVAGHHAIQLTIRTIPTDPPPLSKMELPANILEAMAPQEGVVYVTGATGSGKSTLLASIIGELAKDPDSNRKILTYEAPIEFVFDSIDKPSSVVSQSEIPRHLPSFAAGVRNALRRKPRLILVGEARDPETISAVLEAALTGHPVYTTLHTTGVAETVRRLVGTFPAEERLGRTIDIIETLRLIIWQKLVPTVDGKRVALREYLIFNEAVRNELLAADPNEVTALTRKLVYEKGQPMIIDAEKKFSEGIISQKEYDLLKFSTRNQ